MYSLIRSVDPLFEASKTHYGKVLVWEVAPLS